MKEAGFKELRYNIGKVILNYAVGPKHGPPIILIPGQTMPWQSYKFVMPGLSRRFTVYAIDVHGHGKSSWLPGGYTYKNIGRDIVDFIREIVHEPAIISGNSSGGIIAVWLAANVPGLIRGIIAEDPPLFSSEWPRLKECYVYHILQRAVAMIDSPKGRNISAFFAGFELPSESGKEVMKMPKFLSTFISIFVNVYQAGNMNKRIDLPFLPLPIRLFVRGLSEYDPGFSKAFLDNSMHEDFDHGKVLSRIKCPVLLIRANSFHHEKWGLVGAMEDRDVEKVKLLVKDLQYLRINSTHMVHIEQPRRFIAEINRFYSQEILN